MAVMYGTHHYFTIAVLSITMMCRVVLRITHRALYYVANPAKQAKVRECERQVDAMVYGLYGLNKQKTDIVE